MAVREGRGIAGSTPARRQTASVAHFVVQEWDGALIEEGADAFKEGVMSFTDGKPRIATEEDCGAPWSGNKDNFRCGLCGYRFKVGDYWRWQFTNNIPGACGNPLICKDCDGPDVIEKWKSLHQEAASDKFWWFNR